MLNVRAIKYGSDKPGTQQTKIASCVCSACVSPTFLKSLDKERLVRRLCHGRQQVHFQERKVQFDSDSIILQGTFYLARMIAVIGIRHGHHILLFEVI